MSQIEILTDIIIQPMYELKLVELKMLFLIGIFFLTHNTTWFVSTFDRLFRRVHLAYFTVTNDIQHNNYFFFENHYSDASKVFFDSDRCSGYHNLCLSITKSSIFIFALSQFDFFRTFSSLSRKSE